MDFSLIVIGGKEVLFSECDRHFFEKKTRLKASSCGKTFYAANGSGTIHRLIMGLVPNDGFEVDHINHNTLDNRRENLRVCTKSENQRNKRSMPGTSKFKGVFWHSAARKWAACITESGRNKYIGVFNVEEDAARAYDREALLLYGEFAYMNFPAQQTASAS